MGPKSLPRLVLAEVKRLPTIPAVGPLVGLAIYACVGELAEIEEAHARESFQPSWNFCASRSSSPLGSARLSAPKALS